MSDSEQTNSSILEKRRMMMSKRSEVLKSMSYIESTLEKIKPAKKERKKRQPVVVDEKNRRKSRRIQGLTPEISIEEAMMEADTQDQEPSSVVTLPKPIKSVYVDFDLTGMEEPIHVDGSYHGWVDPEVCKRHNIPMKNGESLPVPREKEVELDDEMELKSLKPIKTKRFSSSAKETSRKCLRSNPNTYFYRHVEPNEKQWAGEWTAEEIHAFYNTAKQFGCGDKWGLFSSYIPHRVGYQCSNFYRQFFLPKGIIVDPNYIITPHGEAVYKPKKSYSCLSSHTIPTNK